jgi:hypothetical protein
MSIYACLTSEYSIFVRMRASIYTCDVTTHDSIKFPFCYAAVNNVTEFMYNEFK